MSIRRKEGGILFSRGHIRGLGKEIGEEGVADKGILVSLMTRNGHRVGKDGDIYFIAVFVRALIGKSHDAIQEGVRVLFVIVENTFQRGTAPIPLYKNLRALGQSCKVAGSGAIEYVVFIQDVAGIDKCFIRIGNIAQAVDSVSPAGLNIRLEEA